MVRPTLHVLGCGRTARVLARRLHVSGAVEIGQIVNRGLASAREAVEFIGTGTAAAEFDATIEDGWLMLGVPDGVIGREAGHLHGRLPALPELVFHLSGSVPSSALSPLEVPVAAIHPLRAFAEPQQAFERFGGTWCVAEGDAQALAWLRPAFEQAGAGWISFKPTDKAAWHAATVAASNFLVTVNALARELAKAAGMAEVDAARLLADLQHGTLETLRNTPAKDVLTGPIERGDAGACTCVQRAAQSSLNEAQIKMFDALASGTLDLAVEKRGIRESDEQLRQLFTSRSD